MTAIAKFMHVSEEQYASSALPDALPLNDIPLPRRATAGSAGYDFICPADVTLQPGDAITIATGIRCEKLTFEELARLADVYTDWKEQHA